MTLLKGHELGGVENKISRKMSTAFRQADGKEKKKRKTMTTKPTITMRTDVAKDQCSTLLYFLPQLLTEQGNRLKPTV